jgi:hypothetical protein
MIPDLEDQTQQQAIDDGSTGIEAEDTSGQIIKPFDPTKIRINAATLTADLLLQRISDKALDMSPGFQRKGGIWTDEAQSRLVESMLIRIPIPALYVDATDDERWLIVDGLQRLTALHRFVTTGQLRLTGLEFLTTLDGKGFAELEPRYQRRIKETQLILYKIEEGTPANVKFNIFKRINTGGLPLSSQEIRHALNQGPVISVLNHLAESKAFLDATARGISDKRMGAQECVLRFLAFTLIPYTEYKAGDLDGFLNAAMEKLNDLADDSLQAMQHQFVRTMMVSRAIFGNDAFRKRYDPSAARLPVNKALFETWSVNLGARSTAEQEILVKRKEKLTKGFINLMQDRSFDSAISQGTGDFAKVVLRFQSIRRLIEGVLQDD